MTSPDVQAQIDQTRAELDRTLSDIEGRLDVRKHVERLSGQVKRLSGRAQSSYNEKPVPWIVGATAVGIVVLGSIAWAIFTDD